jgi:hypothetical protein
LTTETLQIYGTNLEEYAYTWIYDSGTNTLTLTVPGGLETDASIIVNMEAGLQSTEGTALTAYALGFNTAKLALQSDAPALFNASIIRCAKPKVTIQTPIPTRPRAKWKLHFKILSYLDAACTQLITEVDSFINPELFEYSTDNGLKWIAFPTGGLSSLLYGSLVRARCEVGPRTKVWLRTAVGADDT